MKRSYVEHLGASIGTIAVVALLKFVDWIRADHVIAVALAFGSWSAFLARWWSLAYFVAFAGCALGLGALDVRPYFGEFGLLPAVMISLFTVSVALIGASVVGLCRLGILVYRRVSHHEPSA